MKKLLAMLLATGMLLALCACGESTATQSQVSGNSDSVEVGEASDLVYLDGYWPETYLQDKIVVATSRDGGGFAPIGNSSWGSVEMCYYQKLLYVDSQGKDRLQMLKSIEEVDDQTYNCEIWSFIYDTDHNNITADDVKYSIQLYVDAGQKGGVNCLNLLDGDIVDIDVTGTYTFTWHCSQPFGIGELGKNFSNPTIISQAGYEASGEDKYLTRPVGTGPYMLESYTLGSKAIFVANPDFWMKNIEDEDWLAENFYAIDCQNVREIEYDIIQDASTRAMALEMGDVCAIDTANAADIEAYISNPAYGISPVRKRVGAPLAFYFNCNEASVCSDINLRMAICYALDCAGISSGISYPAYEVFGPQPNMYDAPESWTTGDGVEYYNYNVELAKEYLSKSGYDGKTLTLMYIDQGAITDFVIMLQSNLRQVGINIEMMPLEATTMDAYRSDYEAWDIIADIQGGGNYCANTLKKFWTGDYTDSKGNSVLGIVDSKLDDLYLKVKNEGGIENIEAWNDYFTYEKCYGLAVCRYFEQTACLSSVNAVVVGANNMLVAGAFTFND